MKEKYREELNSALESAKTQLNVLKDERLLNEMSLMRDHNKVYGDVSAPPTYDDMLEKPNEGLTEDEKRFKKDVAHSKILEIQTEALNTAIKDAEFISNKKDLENGSEVYEIAAKTLEKVLDEIVEHDTSPENLEKAINEGVDKASKKNKLNALNDKHIRKIDKLDSELAKAIEKNRSKVETKISKVAAQPEESSESSSIEESSVNEPEDINKAQVEAAISEKVNDGLEVVESIEEGEKKPATPVSLLSQEDLAKLDMFEAELEAGFEKLDTAKQPIMEDQDKQSERSLSEEELDDLANVRKQAVNSGRIKSYYEEPKTNVETEPLVSSTDDQFKATSDRISIPKKPKDFNSAVQEYNEARNKAIALSDKLTAYIANNSEEAVKTVVTGQKNALDTVVKSMENVFGSAWENTARIEQATNVLKQATQIVDPNASKQTFQKARFGGIGGIIALTLVVGIILTAIPVTSPFGIAMIAGTVIAAAVTGVAVRNQIAEGVSTLKEKWDPAKDGNGKLAALDRLIPAEQKVTSPELPKAPSQKKFNAPNIVAALNEHAATVAPVTQPVIAQTIAAPAPTAVPQAQEASTPKATGSSTYEPLLGTSSNKNLDVDDLRLLGTKKGHKIEKQAEKPVELPENPNETSKSSAPTKTP